MDTKQGITVKMGVYDLPGFVEIENSGKGDGQCWLKYALGHTINAFIEQILKRGMNCTFTGFEEMGTYDQDKEKYTQLIGAVQSGDVDVSLIPVYYPLKDDVGIFHYTPTVNEDEMYMVLVYNVTHSTHISDILFMYSNIPRILWIGLIISFLIFASIITFGQKTLKPKMRIRAIFTTLAAFLNDDDYSFTFNDLRCSRFLLVLTLSISIFSFIFSNLFNNIVGAEMVTIDKAYAPTSYKEIVERNMTGMFNKAFPEYEKFRDSPVDSYERKIYEKAQFFTIGPEAFLKLERPIIDQETTLVARRLIVEAGGLALFSLFGSKYPDARLLLNKDAQAGKYTNVFVINKNSNSHFKEIADKIVTSIYEHGIMSFLYSKLPEGIAGDLVQPVTPSVYRKLTPTVEEDEPILVPVGIINTIHFFQCLISLVLIALIVLIFEYFKSKCEKKQDKESFIEYKRPARAVMLENIRNQRRNVRKRRRFNGDMYQTPLRRYLNSYQHANGVRQPKNGLVINRLIINYIH